MATEACGTYPLKISAYWSLLGPGRTEQEVVREDANPSLLLADAWPTELKKARDRGQSRQARSPELHQISAGMTTARRVFF